MSGWKAGRFPRLPPTVMLSVIGPQLQRRPLPCPEAKGMASWSGWPRYVVAASSCAVITALAGCSAGTGASPAPAGTRPASGRTSDGRAGSTATAARPAGSTTSTGSVAPLTGLAVPDAIARRPAVAIAVASSDPVGLGSADLVFGEMTSPVRYLAVFQSDEASRVGPVTSTRPTDGQALSVLHPLLGYDGGTSEFISVLDATRVIDDGYAG